MAILFKYGSYLLVILTIIVLIYVNLPSEFTNVSSNQKVSIKLLEEDSNSLNYKNVVSSKTNDTIDSKVDKKPVISAKRVSVFVHGLGYNNELLKMAMLLPEGISLGFSFYSPNLGLLLDNARKDGHEVLVEIPVASIDNENVIGPYDLMIGNDENNNFNKLTSIVSNAGEFADGFYLASFEENNDLSLYKEIDGFVSNNNLNVLFITDNNEHRELYNIVNKNNIYIADKIIKEKMEGYIINNKLQDAENIARKTGYSVVTIKPSILSLSILTNWIKTIEAKDNRISELERFKEFGKE